ncbi:Potassium channel sub K member 17 [Saguinus oedipus]|uniref:Potassium channel sub K member 17 n=1 Tax=Saguinus oedipus TaxID=9490 RepID=A0ABQ9VZU4_SAGOE|nr:Potassium channel sub K member 17 [Saguinus oedipus]
MGQPLTPVDSPDLRRSLFLHEAPGWSQKPLTSSPVPPYLLSGFPALSPPLLTPSFLSQDWLQELSQEITEKRARAAPKGRVQGCGCVMSSTVLLLLAYLAYLALGTGVFWTLEGPAAQDSSRSFQRDKWALLENFTCLDRPALDSLIRDIIHAYKNGASLLSNTTSMGRWEFVGSFFFSVSTVTTIGGIRREKGRQMGDEVHLESHKGRRDIPRGTAEGSLLSNPVALGPAPSKGGYGNLSPNTMAARLFCIFFALVGIPLNLVVLNRLGHLMQQGVDRCASRLGVTWQDPGKAQWLAGSGALLSGLLLFLLLPPLLFSHMEGWSYMEGFYFSFITLSTVGFGDYVIDLAARTSHSSVPAAGAPAVCVPCGGF